MKAIEGGSCLYLDIYGCTFAITGNAAATIHNLGNDFRFFTTERTESPTRMEVLAEDPPYAEAPEGVASTYTPRNISFTSGGCKYIDYGGKALATWDRNQRLFRIWTRDEDIRYEASFLFLLSRTGEVLDAHRMHRVHAMALGFNGQAVLAILPMGGGKSTLCSALLEYPEFNLLSDDSPYVSRDGVVHAFPLRLGLLPGHGANIPEPYQRTIERMEFGPKVLVNYEYFADRVIPSARPGIVFLGQRTLSAVCHIEPAGSWAQFKSMLVNCVVGLGLYQGLEFVLTHSPVELFRKLPVAWSRLRNARQLFAASQVYRLTLGRDQELNAATVREFVRNNLGENPGNNL